MTMNGRTDGRDEWRVQRVLGRLTSVERLQAVRGRERQLVRFGVRPNHRGAAEVVSKDDDARCAHLADAHTTFHTIREPQAVSVGEVDDAKRLEHFLGVGPVDRGHRALTAEQVDDVKSVARRNDQPTRSPSERRCSIQSAAGTSSRLAPGDRPWSATSNLSSWIGTASYPHLFGR